MIAFGKPADLLARRANPVKRELYRENCQDDEGNRYNVIVWRDWPGLTITSYTLEDGTAVHYEDGCYFTIVPTGKMLTRCED